MWRKILKIRTGLVLILLVLTLSLTTVALTQQNSPTPAWTLTQTTTLQQPTQKGMTITWGTETQANTYNKSNQSYPSVSYFPDGSFVVAWDSLNQIGSYGYDVFAKIFDSKGKNKTGDILVNTYFANNQDAVSVSCFPDGSGFVATWESYEQEGSGYENGIYARIFDSTGKNKTGDIHVNGDNIADDQMVPSVSCFSDGSFVVAWQSTHTGNWDVYFRLFNQTGNPQTGEIRVNSYTTGDQAGPSVSCFSDGSGFVVAWGGSSTGDTSGVYAKVFNKAGTPQTGDIQVNTYTTDTQAGPSVSCFFDGSGFVVTWQSNGQDGSLLGIYAKIFNKAGTPQTGDIQVNTYISDNQWVPSVSCFSDGSFVVVWQSKFQDGSWHGVYAKIFNSTGQNQTGEIRVNTNTTDNQWFASVCCFSDRSFVVAWISVGQDGDGYGIFFRVGYLPALSSVFTLIVLFLYQQSGPIISMPLLLGGGLALAVLVGALALWRFRRRR
jgi:hypothetical protein